MTTARFHPILLGAFGLVPFAALVIGVYAAPLHGSLLVKALLFYGATILAFLGGIHWGVALKADNPPAYLYVSGVLPQLLGFGALLAPVGLGLSLLAVGLIAILATDFVYLRAQHLPAWFLKLRLVLTLGATAALCGALPALPPL